MIPKKLHAKEAVVIGSGDEEMAEAEPKTFGVLEDKVVRPGLCRGCGGCAAVCIYDAIEFKEGLPHLVKPDNCEDCFYCLRVCLALDGLWVNVLMDNLEDPEFYEARAIDESITSHMPDNGALTATMLNALERGFVDAVRGIVAEEDKPWDHKAINARNLTELLGFAGPKYTMIPSAASLDEIRLNQIPSAALVGTPCQIEAARYIAHYRFHQLEDRIKYYVGTFCKESYNYHRLKELLDERLGIGVDRVAKIDIKGEFVVTTKDGSTEAIPTNMLERALWSGCIYCEDLTGRFSDVSFGWASSPEWDAIIVRTEQGKQLINSAKEHGFIELRKMSAEGINRLTEEEEEKIQLGSKRPFLTDEQLEDFRPSATRKP